MHKIDQKIVGYAVKQADAPVHEPVHATINETTARPEQLVGTTYKIKTPTSEHAIYITINDILIEGKLYPYEMFINSKDVADYQWVAALTRVVSAVFRKGGETSFLVNELKAVFDPKGGYFRKGGFVPSLVADIGNILEKHLERA